MLSLVSYIKSLSPKKEDQAILIYGSDYRLWRKGKYLGIATWTQDTLIGDSFQNLAFADSKLVQLVYFPDEWELIIKRQRRV